MAEAIKILILDDDDAVRISLESYLEDCGFACFPIASAEKALDFLEHHSIDLAIVDVRLPGIDGLNFILTAHAKWPTMKYIIFTGSVDIAVPESISKIREVANTIFIKPIDDLNRFVTEINRLMSDS